MSKPITLDVLRDKLALWLPTELEAISEVEPRAMSRWVSSDQPRQSVELPDPLIVRE